MHNQMSALLESRASCQQKQALVFMPQSLMLDLLDAFA